MTEPARKPPVKPSFPLGYRSSWRGFEVSRSSHRIASVALGVAFLIGAPYVLSGYRGQDVWSTIGALLTMASLGTALFLMVTRFNLKVDGEDEELDERERAWRDRAHWVAYRIVAFTLCVALFSLLILDILIEGEWAPAGKNLQMGMLLAVTAAYALPAAILAWIAPDLVPEEETT